MTEVRLHTNIRRMRPLKVYVLEPSVSAVPCQSDGIAREDSFDVSLFLSENNKDRQPAQAHMRYVRCKGASCEAAVESGVSVSSVTVNTGRAESKAYDKFIIQAYTPASSGRHEVVLATLHVSTVRDGEQGRPGSSTIIVPYGSWKAGRTYRSTEDVKIFVERHGMYYVLFRLNEDCLNIDPATIIVPYGSWKAGRTYRSTEDVKIFVERHGMYYVLFRLNEDCLNIDPATDVKNEWWRLMDYVEYMLVNAMVADFGKIASTVFVGNHTISQHGIGPDGSPVTTESGYKDLEYMLVNAMVADFGKIASTVFVGNHTISQHGIGPDGSPVTTESGYKDFGKLSPDGKPLFTPNVLIDWLTGRIEALEMIIKGNSVFGGHLEGTEGTFKLLECTDAQGRKIVLDPSPDGVDKPSVSLYDAEGKKVCNVSFDDKLTRSATIELFRYDSKGNETNSCLLHSNGIVKGTMPGKSFTLTPSGLTYNRVIDGVETRKVGKLC